MRWRRRLRMGCCRVGLIQCVECILNGMVHWVCWSVGLVQPMGYLGQCGALPLSGQIGGMRRTRG